MAVLYSVLQFTYFVAGYFFGQKSHLMDAFARPGRQTMVIGHRGGNFGPENSLMNFKGAIQNHVEGIEFDVWLSSDNVPMVLHGGANGELTMYGIPDEYVWQWSRERLQTELDIGEGERMPTLQELVELCEDAPTMLMNIELKMPKNQFLIDQYDHKLAATKVVDMINDYDIGAKVIVASFNEKILEDVIGAAYFFRQFKIVSIRNYHEKRDPYHSLVGDAQDGIVALYKYLTPEKVQKLHSSHNYIGLYKPYHQSEEEMWPAMFTCSGGVDFIYSDFPVEAMRARQKLQASYPFLH